jgi:hypothetical protein
MKLAIATLLAALSLSTLVKADATQYRVRWTFTQLTGSHYEDYSTNLDVLVGALLPIAAVKEGWACTRSAVISRDVAAGLPTAPYEEGKFECTNGRDWGFAVAKCELDKINTDYGYLDIKLPGAPSGIQFKVSCAALPQ